MDSFAQVFDYVKDFCLTKGLVSDAAYRLWLDHLEPLELEGQTAYLGVSSSYAKGILEQNYTGKLETAFSEILGFPVNVVFLSQEDRQQMKPAETEVKPAPMPSSNSYEYTFDTFIVGPSNNFAYAAATAVAARPANNYNPFFIYGPSGLGKTHLMLAIRHEILARDPGKKIMYVKCEEFTNELINAISNKTTSDFHEKYRSVDVLLMDDVQFLAGKDRAQEEFFHTFERLYQNGRQIVLTSDRPPKEIKTLEERLLTRFEMGLLADIQPPDFETRIAIIRRKAKALDLEIPDEVANHLANKLKSNIRQLEGAVKKLSAYKILDNAEPTLSFAQRAISDILSDNQPGAITVDRIIEEVAKTFEVTSDDICSGKRSANISIARQAAIYVVREVMQMSTLAVGKKFGNRDHSTIVYATKQIQKQMETDPRFKATIEDIIKNVQN